MKRILRILGLAMVLSALLVVSITGAVFAAGDNAKGPQSQTQNQYEECPCEECPCGDCLCDGDQLKTRTQSEINQQVNNPDTEKGNRNQKRTRSSWIVD